MTEGFFSEPADDEDPGSGATDAAEYGQQTGLSEAAALRRLADMGCDPVAAANALAQAPHARDGIVYLNGIRVRWDEGYGYCAERGPVTACGAPSGNADITGICCGLPAGHRGLHEAATVISWGDDL